MSHTVSSLFGVIAVNQYQRTSIGFMVKRLRQTLLGVDTSVGRFACQSLWRRMPPTRLAAPIKAPCRRILQPLDGSCSLLEENSQAACYVSDDTSVVPRATVWANRVPGTPECNSIPLSIFHGPSRSVTCELTSRDGCGNHGPRILIFLTLKY